MQVLQILQIMQVQQIVQVPRLWMLKLTYDGAGEDGGVNVAQRHRAERPPIVGRREQQVVTAPQGRQHVEDEGR